jgi:hypothetical protein
MSYELCLLSNAGEEKCPAKVARAWSGSNYEPLDLLDGISVQDKKNRVKTIA